MRSVAYHHPGEVISFSEERSIQYCLQASCCYFDTVKFNSNSTNNQSCVELYRKEVVGWEQDGKHFIDLEFLSTHTLSVDDRCLQMELLWDDDENIRSHSLNSIQCHFKQTPYTSSGGFISQAPPWLWFKFMMRYRVRIPFLISKVLPVPVLRVYIKKQSFGFVPTTSSPVCVAMAVPSVVVWDEEESVSVLPPTSESLINEVILKDQDHRSDPTQLDVSPFHHSFVRSKKILF